MVLVFGQRGGDFNTLIPSLPIDSSRWFAKMIKVGLQRRHAKPSGPHQAGDTLTSDANAVIVGELRVDHRVRPS
jgi:hypothetical protein